MTSSTQLPASAPGHEYASGHDTSSLASSSELSAELSPVVYSEVKLSEFVESLMIGQWYQDGDLVLQSTLRAMKVNLSPVDTGVYEQEPLWTNEARKLIDAASFPKK